MLPNCSQLIAKHLLVAFGNTTSYVLSSIKEQLNVQATFGYKARSCLNNLVKKHCAFNLCSSPFCFKNCFNRPLLYKALLYRTKTDLTFAQKSKQNLFFAVRDHTVSTFVRLGSFYGRKIDVLLFVLPCSQRKHKEGYKTYQQKQKPGKVK